MKNVRNLVLALVVVLLVVSSVNATTLNQSFNYQGIEVSSYANNYEDNSCSASVSGYLEQGVNGRYYNYDSSNSSIYSHINDRSKFTYYYYANFEVVSAKDFVRGVNLDLYSNTNVNLFGINLSQSIEIRNREHWFGGDDEWYSIKTDNPEFSSWFNLTPGKIENTYLNVSTNVWEDYNWETQEYTNRTMIQINFQAYGHFIAPTIEEARAIGMNFVVIPEPTTILIVGFGGLLVKIRK